MKLKINKVHTEELRIFIKKLILMDSFIFLKLNDKVVSSSVYLPQRDAVKVVSVPLNLLFDLDSSIVEDQIKISFYNASRILDALSFMNGKNDDISGEIVYDKIGEDYIATDFKIKNEKTKINLYCADPSLSFIDMSKDELKRAFNIDNALFSFEITKENLIDMKKFFSFDKEKETYKLITENNKAFLIGENYNFTLSDSVSIFDNSLSEVMMYKKYLQLIDKEDYTLTVCTNKIFLKSQETNTMLIIAICLTGDN